MLSEQSHQTPLLAASVSNCHLYNLVAGVFFAFSNCSISLLFFYRLRAVYLYNRPVVLSFFLLWVGNAICVFLDPILQSVVDTRVPGTMVCAFWEIKPALFAVLVISSWMNDTAVFFAIAYRLYRISSYLDCQSLESKGRVGNRIWSFIRGKNLSAFLKAFLLDGQIFYLISFFMSIAVTVLILVPSNHDVTVHFILLIPHVAIMNCIACYVFRHVRLGNIREDSLTTVETSEIKFRTNLDFNSISSESETSQSREKYKSLDR
ncbi:hypothetical protein K435DRAFT_699396 [Dendrothele bispora CBS 962.96]|uniref:Uncharacterized protein n=1 Tax=Dendrothele bispora (strain CBS 962.96) TaxID=1314807 RepID=A0A4S8KSV0_DENBC|nr:hypothetical protein K435DRAFT_699396 [Dendrothele bispora CBS 962.96]